MNGQQLKDWRTESGYSQSEAAKRLGVGRSTLQKWEASSEDEVPKWAALAVSAINRRLAPYPGKK